MHSYHLHLLITRSPLICLDWINWKKGIKMVSDMFLSCHVNLASSILLEQSVKGFWHYIRVHWEFFDWLAPLLNTGLDSGKTCLVCHQSGLGRAIHAPEKNEFLWLIGPWMEREAEIRKWLHHKQESSTFQLL